MTLQDPLVGRVVDGRYLVESRIARGGMATVYLALDRRLDREVALKVMHDNLALDPEFVSRFIREARAAARLSHPNVVQVFDQGSDGPVLYLAMEYLPGRTLRDVLVERGALTPRESVSVLEPVLGALAAAHRAGIVHGDVKPENVILTDDGRIKVADFGLARAITAPITVTAKGELLGTVAYLAPELVSRGIADARADVYAVGIMLFELITGKQPFTGTDPLQVAYRHVHESVPAPTSLAPQLPFAFDQVVQEATSHDPDRRPRDAAELLIDLHAAQDRVPDGQLDVRAADAITLRLDSASQTELLGATMSAPAAAVMAQPTRALATTRRENRGGGMRPGGGNRPGGQMDLLVPRLRVHDEEPPPPGFLGDRNQQAIAAIAGAVVLVLLICSGIWWFTGGPGSYTSTPALTGERVADAERILATQGLHSRVTQVFSTTVAADQVISTDPPGGKHVKKGGIVGLTVSKGPQLLPVPNVTGQSAADATAAIKSAGLAVGTTTKKYSATAPSGQVLSSSPKAGTRIAPGRTVDLVVSKGIQQVPLDNVLNQNVTAATQLLQSHGFDVPTPGQQPFVIGGPAPGTVVAEDPNVQQPGQTAPKGSTVTLTVVGQPLTPTAPATPTPIPVPSVVGEQFEQARQQLQQAGFQVTKQGGGFFGGHQVIAQSVNGQAPPGTNIVLTVT